LYCTGIALQQERARKCRIVLHLACPSDGCQHHPLGCRQLTLAYAW
jgi:hypothetical protein